MITRSIISKIAPRRPGFRSFSRTASPTASQAASQTASQTSEKPNLKTTSSSKFVEWVTTSFFHQSGLERNLLVPKSLRQKPGVLGGVQNVQARPGRVTFDLIIDDRHTNRLNILHGGTIASIVDFGGSLAVASKGLYSTGVSTDLNVSYLGNGGAIGDLVKVEARCDKLGKTLAYTSITFKNKKGELLARGSHTKFIKLAQKAQTEIGTPYRIPREELKNIRALVESTKVKSSNKISAGNTPQVEDAAEENKIGENGAEENNVQENSVQEDSVQDNKAEESKSEENEAEGQGVEGSEGSEKPTTGSN